MIAALLIDGLDVNGFIPLFEFITGIVLRMLFEVEGKMIHSGSFLARASAGNTDKSQCCGSERFLFAF
jgi:hypothetical protein